MRAYLMPLLMSLGMVLLSINTGAAQIGQPSEGDAPSMAYHVVDVATFDELRKHKANVRIDVRDPDEVALNKLGGSLEIDFESASFVGELEKLDKEVHYLVFSSNGTNGAKAAQKMIDLGFTNVSNLQGGFAKWMATERPPE
jgi:rhodanese-related sulfurtransferase